jgi:signal transduction histidine kinase
MPERLRGLTTVNFLQAVLNPARLAALRRLGLLDSPAEEAFDRLGALAARLLHAPVALVSLVDDDRQFFKSCLGLPEPWNHWRDTPLSHSFCKHVVATSEPLIISDATVDPLFRENLAIRDLGVVAYLGIPLRTTGSHVLGSFCVIDSKPREWTDDEIATVTVLADCVMTEIELRSEIARREAAEKELRHTNEALRSFGELLSHDMRAPLRHILSFSNVLRESLGATLEPDDRHCLEAIANSSRDATAMVEGLEALASVVRRPLEHTQVDLTALAQSVVKQLQASDPHPATVSIEENMQAFGDPALLRLLLSNLIGNAWKFSGRVGAPRVDIGQLNQNGASVFFIRDNGIGFSEEEKQALFTTKTRLPSARGFAGSGLGLHTVKRIIERHEGRIWADAKPREGAVFYFTLESAGKPSQTKVAGIGDLRP